MKIIRKLIIFCSLFCVSLAAVAEDSCTWLALYNASYHFTRKDENGKSINHNESNNGIGGEFCVWDHTRFVLGQYQNSYYVTSRYVGALYTPYETKLFGKEVKVGFLAGGINGYQSNTDKFALLFIPVVAIEGKRIGFNVTAIPPLHGANVPGLLGLQLKIRLDTLK